MWGQPSACRPLLCGESGLPRHCCSHARPTESGSLQARRRWSNSSYSFQFHILVAHKLIALLHAFRKILSTGPTGLPGRYAATTPRSGPTCSPNCMHHAPTAEPVLPIASAGARTVIAPLVPPPALRLQAALLPPTHPVTPPTWPTSPSKRSPARLARPRRRCAPLAPPAARRTCALHVGPACRPPGRQHGQQDGMHRLRPMLVAQSVRATLRRCAPLLRQPDGACKASSAAQSGRLLTSSMC